MCVCVCILRQFTKSKQFVKLKFQRRNRDVHWKHGENCFQVKEAWIEIEGQRYPNVVYSVAKWDTDENAAEARHMYLELLRIMQQKHGISCGITYDMFLNGFTIIAFQISEALPSKSYTSDKRLGDCVLHFTQTAATTKPIHVFALGMFQSTILMTNTNGIIKNFTL